MNAMLTPRSLSYQTSHRHLRKLAMELLRRNDNPDINPESRVEGLPHLHGFESRLCPGSSPHIPPLPPPAPAKNTLIQIHQLNHEPNFPTDSLLLLPGDSKSHPRGNRLPIHRPRETSFFGRLWKCQWAGWRCGEY